MTEFQAMQIATLIRDSGLSAQEACKLTGVARSTLNNRLTTARKQAQEVATEMERLKQPHYAFLKSYQSALQERSKMLRRQRGRPQERKAAMEKHPMIYRNLLSSPQSEREKLLGHIRHGSFVADAAEAVKVHASVAHAWLQRGLDAFLGDQEDAESLEYLTFYLDVLQAFAEARTSASERVHADSALSYLLFGPGRETPERQGYVKSSRVTQHIEKQPIEIKTVWATAPPKMQIQAGVQPTYRVEYPSGYEPPRFDENEDEG